VRTAKKVAYSNLIKETVSKETQKLFLMLLSDQTDSEAPLELNTLNQETLEEETLEQLEALEQPGCAPCTTCEKILCVMLSLGCLIYLILPSFMN